MYEITGIYPAPSFFELRRLQDGSARIRLIADLRTDSLQIKQYIIRVAAWDSVYPNMRVEKDVFINVGRNLNGPRFVPRDTYEESLSDGYSVGGKFLTVRAEDEDDEVRI